MKRRLLVGAVMAGAVMAAVLYPVVGDAMPIGQPPTALIVDTGAGTPRVDTVQYYYRRYYRPRYRYYRPYYPRYYRPYYRPLLFPFL